MSKEKNKNHETYFTKRFKVFICGSMILATILGIYGQSIAYYISDRIEKISPVHCITALILISIILFLTTSILIYKFIKKQNLKKLIPYLVINSFIGILVSVFSLFVMIMWWE